MNVRELIELLEQYDDTAEVLFISQPSWPFEYAIAGVIERSDIDDPDEDEIDRSGRDGMMNDVLLVEGSQLRYGSKLAWDYA